MEFEINKQSLIVRTSVEAKVGDLESFLLKNGLTLGAFQPPVGEPEFTVADWLGDPLIPPCNWAGGTLLERIVSITADGKGGRLVTNMAPRSATGPDLNYLVASTSGRIAAIRGLWLRVRPAPEKRGEAVYRFERMEQAIAALGALAHRKAVLESAHFIFKSGFQTLVLVHDVGTELGRARAKFADSIARAAGGTVAEAGVSMERKDLGGGASFVMKVEVLPSSAGEIARELRRADVRVVEVYASYSNAGALKTAFEVFDEAGFRCAALRRYGTVGCSLRFIFDSGIPGEIDRKALVAISVAKGTVVSGGGAFLTRWANRTVEDLFERLKADG